MCSKQSQWGLAYRREVREMKKDLPKEEKVLRKEGFFILDDIGNKKLCFLIPLAELSSLWWVSRWTFKGPVCFCFLLFLCKSP